MLRAPLSLPSPLMALLRRLAAAAGVFGALRLLLLLYRRWFRAKRLEGRTTLVTGAASGIGRGVALEIARRGGHLVLMDINGAGLEETRMMVSKQTPGVECDLLTCDISRAENVRSVMSTARQTVAAKGRHISCIVNNAGIVVGRRFLDLSVRDVERTMAVNCISNFHLLREILPGMVARNDGCVVTVASTMGMVAAGHLSDYCASKAAQIRMHEAVRLEMREDAPGIQFLLVCPWHVKTNMFANIGKSGTIGERISQTLFPSLEPDFVIRRIVDGMESGETHIIMPWALRFVPWALKLLLPSEVLDFVSEQLGATTTMKTFHPNRQEADTPGNRPRG